MRDDWKGFEGQVFNKFPLQRFLGSTSCTAVFFTQSPPPEQKRIAIKFINPAKVEFQLSLLLRASKLNHPNLLRVLPGGCSQLGGMDLVLVVMEYAEKNLGQGLADRALSENEAREMLGAVLDALNYIHSKRFAHSHIKPSNIMAVGDQLKLSSDTVLPVGEPRPTYRPLDVYTAPETGPAPVAPSSDVWSLARDACGSVFCCHLQTEIGLVAQIGKSPDGNQEHRKWNVDVEKHPAMIDTEFGRFENLHFFAFSVCQPSEARQICDTWRAAALQTARFVGVSAKC